MVVYQCSDSFDGILCGVYDAWMSRLGHDNVRLALADTGNLEMFVEYRTVEETKEKLDKVIHAIRQKIGLEVYRQIYQVSLSRDEEKADRIYRYLISGFRYGARVVDMLQLPEVYEVFQMCRFIGNEAHLLIEFARFAEMEEGILLCRVGPKNDVIVLMAPHFADRLSCENWIIYDENRKKAVVHPANGQWLLMNMDDLSWRERMSKGTDEAVYADLWKAFHRGIAIKERTNYVCQRTHLPLRYRPYMTEFEEEKPSG